MVKLASVRDTRLYGPAGSKDVWEDVNAFGYLVAALLLTAGTVLLFPGYNAKGGLWLILVAVVIIALVNLHDLYAQVAGVDFRPSLATLDSQLVAIEIAAPIVQTIGAIIYFVGALLLLLVARGDYNESKSSTLTKHAYILLIVAPALWLLGSIHNSFQVYESTELDVQAYQKGVSLPFVIGSLLLVLGSIVNVLSWPPAALHTGQRLAGSLAVAGAALLLVGAVVNAVKVIHTQQTQQTGGRVEKLRGGAHEALVEGREEAGTYAPVNKDDHYTEIESGHGGNPYKKNIVPADR
jgi:hypothetical protein